jgi:hypothetical protein
MNKSIRLLCLLFLILPLKPTFARGDKVIPQVADGAGFRTKLDLFCPSFRQGINNYWLLFFKHDGSPWLLETTAGTASQFRITLAARQTLRLETLGHSNPGTAGYAVLEDREPGISAYSQDHTIGISVYYEISSDGIVVDTVSVPVEDATGAATFPVEMDVTNQISTGLAIVNRYHGANPISITLFSANGSQAANASFTLQESEYRAEFLDQNLFPNLTGFKGMAEIVGQGGPVSIIALLQTGTAGGPRYTTLVPTDKEVLRRNSSIFLVEPSVAGGLQPLDVDGFVADYFAQSDGPGQCCESYPWDLVYVYVDEKTRKLRPQNNASFAALGNLSSADFDLQSLTGLKALTYSSNDIDLSDGSVDLAAGFAFAIRTDLGNYAKARIARILNTGNGTIDLGLEVYVFK